MKIQFEQAEMLARQCVGRRIYHQAKRLLGETLVQYEFVHTHTNTNICICKHTNAHKNAHTGKYTQTHACTYAHKCTYTEAQACAHMQMYIPMPLHTSTRKYTFTYLTINKLKSKKIDVFFTLYSYFVLDLT